jgi:hypothetical protein
MADASDNITLSIRMHDPKEKANAALSASWHIVKVPREDIQAVKTGQMSKADFATKYLLPALDNLEHTKCASPPAFK